VEYALQEKFTISSREGFSSRLQHSVASFLLTGSPQFSSSDCLLGAFVIWVPAFSLRFCAEEKSVIPALLGGQLLASMLGKYILLLQLV
jgi:hypothetical protein